MYRSIGASSSRWGLLIPQLKDVRWVREAPTFLFSGAYVADRRRHTLMMLIRGSGSIRRIIRIRFSQTNRPITPSTMNWYS
jgi:hypothetical protein